MVAYDSGHIELHSEVNVRIKDHEDGWLKTTPGRIIFNEVLPEEVRSYQKVMDKKELKELVTSVYRIAGNETTSVVLDKLKQIGFHYATISGTTIGITDIKVPKEKAAIIAKSNLICKTENIPTVRIISCIRADTAPSANCHSKRSQM